MNKVPQLKRLFYAGFAKRLTEGLLNKGASSPRYQDKADAGVLANICGCSRAMAGRYLMGLDIPRDEWIIKIAEYLEVTAEWLIQGPQARIIEHDKQSLLVALSKGKALIDPDNLLEESKYHRSIENIIRLYENVLKMSLPAEERKEMMSLALDAISPPSQ